MKANVRLGGNVHTDELRSYCDPPYINRHVDYYGSWDDDEERRLNMALSKSEADFLLSTWHHNDFRSNEYIDALWSDHRIITQEHFYHVGGREENRNSMIEALVTNLPLVDVLERQPTQQLELEIVD